MQKYSGVEHAVVLTELKSSFCLWHVIKTRVVLFIHCVQCEFQISFFDGLLNWTYPRILQHDRERAAQTAGGIRLWESLWQPVCHAGFLPLTCRQSSPGTRCPWHQWRQGQVSVKRSWPQKKSIWFMINTVSQIIYKIYKKIEYHCQLL